MRLIVFVAVGAALVVACKRKEPARATCVPTQMPDIPAPTGDDEVSVELRLHRAWLDALPVCTAATRAAASNVAPDDVQSTIDRKLRVTLAGHLESGTRTGNLAHLSRPSSGCYLTTVAWDLLLCTGKRFQLLVAPDQPRGSMQRWWCASRVLAGRPWNIIVSGRITDAGTIADATFCRP